MQYAFVLKSISLFFVRVVSPKKKKKKKSFDQRKRTQVMNQIIGPTKKKMCSILPPKMINCTSPLFHLFNGKWNAMDIIISLNENREDQLNIVVGLGQLDTWKIRKMPREKEYHISKYLSGACTKLKKSFTKVLSIDSH